MSSPKSFQWHLCSVANEAPQVKGVNSDCSSLNISCICDSLERASLSSVYHSATGKLENSNTFSALICRSVIRHSRGFSPGPSSLTLTEANLSCVPVRISNRHDNELQRLKRHESLLHPSQSFMDLGKDGQRTMLNFTCRQSLGNGIDTMETSPARIKAMTHHSHDTLREKRSEFPENQVEF